MYKKQDIFTLTRMYPMLKKGFDELADEVERSVPAWGKFIPVFYFFEDETNSLDIVRWSIKVRNLIYDNCDRELLGKRYIELVGYFDDGYCLTQIVGSGSKEECVALLRLYSFVVTVSNAMTELLDICD